MAGRQLGGETLVFRASEDQNDLTLRLNTNDPTVLELFDNGRYAVLSSWPIDVAGVLITGSDDIDDTLTVDLSAQLPFDFDIEFNGGAGGFDSLEVMGNSSLTVDYTAIGADSGIIRLSNGLATTTISFTGLEPVTVSNVADYTFTTSGGTDVIMIDSPAPGQNRISGTSGGVSFESVTFFDVTNFTLDTATNDALDNDADSVIIDSTGLVAGGLQNFSIITGDGDDMVRVVPSAVVAITVDGGPGYDRLIVDPQGGDATVGQNSITVAGMQLVTFTAETEEVVLVPGVCDVFLGRLINYEAPGTALDDGYEYGVEVAGVDMGVDFEVIGVDILDVEITTPWVRLSPLTNSSRRTGSLATTSRSLAGLYGSSPTRTGTAYRGSSSGGIG